MDMTKRKRTEVGAERQSSTSSLLSQGIGCVVVLFAFILSHRGGGGGPLPMLLHTIYTLILLGCKNISAKFTT
jgi:hypothetical protein